MRTIPFEVVQIDYQWTNDQIKLLTDIRFRLIAIASPLVGTAVTLLSAQTLGTTSAAPTQPATAAVLTAAVALFGFMVTLGVVLYDLRNSQLYNALVHRAKILEGVLGCVGSGAETMTRPPSAKKKPPDARPRIKDPHPVRDFADQGGLQTQRAGRYGTFLRFEISHGSGLSMIYSALLSSWVFPFLKATLLLGVKLSRAAFGPPPDVPEVSWIISGVAAVGAITMFSRLRRLHSQKDVGALANLLGYMDREQPAWQKNYTARAEALKKCSKAVA
jgi:hypothetical protein